jgi:hypothetical protein
MPKKTANELTAMNDNQFTTYKHTLEIEEMTTLENEAILDAELKAFDIAHPYNLSNTEKIQRSAIFTAHGKTPPLMQIEGKKP